MPTKHPFRFHYVFMPILALFGMIGITAVALPGCTDKQIKDFTQPTVITVPSSQPTSQPTTQPGPSKQDQILNGIDTAQGYLSTIGQVASLFPGKTATTVGLVVGLLGVAVGVGRKTVQNPPRNAKELLVDVAEGVKDVAGAAANIPGAGPTAGKVIAGATVAEAVINATQNPPTPPNTPA